MDTKRIADDWRIPDALWERIEPLLPKYPKSPKGGRPRANLRAVLDGIFYVLRTGCQWKAAPPEFGSGSALHHYFQEWTAKGIFRDLWRVALYEYDELKGIQWEWQSLDGTMTKAPLGGGENRSQPHRPSQVRDQAFAADRRPRGSLGRGGLRSQHSRQMAGVAHLGERADPAPGGAARFRDQREPLHGQGVRLPRCA